MATIVHDQQYIAGGHFKLPVAGTAVPLTLALIQKTLGTQIHSATRVFISVETYPIYYTIDGTAPTTNGDLGHYADTGDQIQIGGWHNIKNFQAIRVGSNSANLKVTPMFNNTGDWTP